MSAIETGGRNASDQPNAGEAAKVVGGQSASAWRDEKVLSRLNGPRRAEKKVGGSFLREIPGARTSSRCPRISSVSDIGAIPGNMSRRRGARHSWADEAGETRQSGDPNSTPVEDRPSSDRGAAEDGRGTTAMSRTKRIEIKTIARRTDRRITRQQGAKTSRADHRRWDADGDAGLRVATSRREGQSR